MADQASCDLILTDIESAYSGSKPWRIFTLMGPNGSGKTRQITKLRQDLKNINIQTIFIPAIRQASFHANQGISINIDDQTLDEITSSIVGSFLQNETRRHLNVDINSAIAGVLNSIVRQQEGIKNIYKDKLFEWRSAKLGLELCPPEPKDLMHDIEKVICELLGYECKIKIVNSGHGQIPITFKHKGVEFQATSLSDGEKQILMMTIFLLSNFDKKIVFIVDEPELHLNESRAVQIWQRFENQFYNSIFIYATHSLVFATRQTADRTYLISRSGSVENIDTSIAVPLAVVREIVGARIQILRSDLPPIFCEDNLLKVIIESIMPNSRLELIPCNGCEGVISAIKSESGWKDLRSRLDRFCGVIDRDARSESEVSALQESNIICFPFYEAESILLSKEVVLWYVRISMGRNFSDDWYEDVLIEAAQRSLDSTLYQISHHVTLNNPCKITWNRQDLDLNTVSVEKPSDLEGNFRKLAKEVFDTINSRDLESILVLIKGKVLYQHFVSIAASKYKIRITTNANQKFNEIRAYREFNEIISASQKISQFRDKILSIVQ